ncbi:GTPase [Arcanobacterium canis]|uniref:50S ribosome-binding GTPase n=1 Tax=Arcanobacterium canis TaxID=999183 RepID=A0ABY8FWC8_9ACTO|nr:GTPase [Arcanobacterium canis]WFM82662.1 50S ribosome-binding GTPase [Arcanobacterium canis]
MTCVAEGIGALRSALDAGESFLPQEIIDEASKVLELSVARTHVGEDVCVIAFAGSTGSGKSSLVNALAGEELVRVAPLRPTTSEPMAVMNVHEPALLDWLDIRRRHVSAQLGERFSVNGKIMLVDLPDIDSIQIENQSKAHAIIERADVTVWVLDPQKYADAVVHEDYLSQLREHSEALVIVLNKVDLLNPDERQYVENDVARLIADDGVSVRVLPVSVASGEGLAELSQLLGTKVEAADVQRTKIAADLRMMSKRISATLVADHGKYELAPMPSFAPVAHAVAQASGAESVARAAGGSYRVRGRSRTSWWFTRWVHQRRDPLKVLRLDTPAGKVAPTTGLIPSPGYLAAAEGEGRRFCIRATEGMPRMWARRVQTQGQQHVQQFLSRIDPLLASVNVERDRTPIWWHIANVMQWLFALVAIIGYLWLGLKIFGPTLGLFLPDPARVGIFEVPLLMCIFAMLGGLIVSACCVLFVRRGAAKVERRVRTRIENAVLRASEDGVLEPLVHERHVYEGFVDAMILMGNAKA